MWKDKRLVYVISTNSNPFRTTCQRKEKDETIIHQLTKQFIINLWVGWIEPNSYNPFIKENYNQDCAIGKDYQLLLLIIITSPQVHILFYS